MRVVTFVVSSLALATALIATGMELDMSKNAYVSVFLLQLVLFGLVFLTNSAERLGKVLVHLALQVLYIVVLSHMLIMHGEEYVRATNYLLMKLTGRVTLIVLAIALLYWIGTVGTANRRKRRRLS